MMEFFCRGIHCCSSEVISNLLGKITAVSVRNNMADLIMVEMTRDRPIYWFTDIFPDI